MINCITFKFLPTFLCEIFEFLKRKLRYLKKNNGIEEHMLICVTEENTLNKYFEHFAVYGFSILENSMTPFHCIYVGC